ncbi:Os04g0514900 [Oryza sativa Japonica Group]|uniref:Os04g0514900 protein n=1 Tax=Oryza sativa subsp. japonica TaxID=39947 RepID=A0A0P0WCJ7_ORYSJ|nr:hypothetical protein EE612_024392 [Oryza sativa]BAS90072.1 Os04g0514900 [Oryza sativa Japonica Group]
MQNLGRASSNRNSLAYLQTVVIGNNGSMKQILMDKIYRGPYLNWGQHLLFTDSIILLLLCTSFQTLPRKTDTSKMYIST